MFKIVDLENFLKKKEGEWWTPSEIGLELGVDLRTVKNVIRRLDSMIHKSWMLVIAERGDRLYVVRMVRDTKQMRIQTLSKKNQTLNQWIPSAREKGER